jgi:hypothetical protein
MTNEKKIIFALIPRKPSRPSPINSSTYGFALGGRKLGNILYGVDKVICLRTTAVSSITILVNMQIKSKHISKYLPQSGISTTEVEDVGNSTTLLTAK